GATRGTKWASIAAPRAEDLTG
ncbi:hypothetical protein A2U01_0119591, partial [Trifolium medium]|nr:hypothetical protein [Trifolium medium]